MVIEPHRELEDCSAQFLQPDISCQTPGFSQNLSSYCSDSTSTNTAAYSKFEYKRLGHISNGSDIDRDYLFVFTIQMTTEGLHAAALWMWESHWLWVEMENWVQTSLGSVWSSNLEVSGLPVQWVDEMVTKEPDERSSSRGSHGDPDSLLVIDDVCWDWGLDPWFVHSQPLDSTPGSCSPSCPIIGHTNIILAHLSCLCCVISWSL